MTPTPVEHLVRTKYVVRADVDAITLAHDDSRAGQSNRAVVGPALAVPEAYHTVLELTVLCHAACTCSDIVVIFWHMMIAGQSPDLEGLLLSALPWRYLILSRGLPYIL